GVGLYFSLRPKSARLEQTIDDVLERVRNRGVAEPAILDWQTGLDLVTKLPQQAVFSPPSSEATLPYLDHSIDIVAVPAGNADAVREADRVAESAVLVFTDRQGDGHPAPSVTVRWNSVLERAAPPTVSIVIPCLNGIAHTDACLTALGETLPDDFAGEIIIVDDGSNTETVARLIT